jgi:hypothetical protein
VNEKPNSKCQKLFFEIFVKKLCATLWLKLKDKIKKIEGKSEWTAHQDILPGKYKPNCNFYKLPG